MEHKPQTFANHARFDPAFDFFLVPVLALNVIVIAIQLFRFPGVLGAWLLLISVALFVFCVLPARNSGGQLIWNNLSPLRAEAREGASTKRNLQPLSH